MDMFISSTTMGFPSTPLEAKQALGISGNINAVSTGLRSGSPMMTTNYETPLSFAKVVENWKSKEIVRWIEGLGDQMNPYLGLIRSNIKSGRQLEALDDDSLKKMGISALGARKTILQAISLLMYFCYESEHENLQRLAQKVKASCQYIEKTMLFAMRMREKAARRAEIVSILNSVSNAVLMAAENTKKLVFWLDRTPFDDMSSYIECRNTISSMMWNLLRNVNVSPKALFETGQQIIKIAKEMGVECRKLIDSEDPLILYASFVEVAVMKRRENSINWGLNIQSSYRGVHVISEIKEGSPADGCTKVDAGDEILMINGRTVVGWDLTTVAQRVGSDEFSELALLIKRRPREAQLPKQSKLVTRAMAPTSQTAKTYSTDEQDPFVNSEMLPLLKRHRSCHAITEILKENEERREAHRRALRRSSVASSCPRREIKQNYQGSYEENDDIRDGEEEALVPRIVKRARTMRHQPDGYVRSFIDNKLVCDIEDDVVNDQLTFNVKCPTEFAQISVVQKDELDRLTVPEARIQDDEWAAPYKEFTAPGFRATGDSNVSGYSLESPAPLSARLRCSVEEAAHGAFSVLPSPSTSSMTSVSSPAPFGKSPLMTSSLTEWTTNGGEFHVEQSPGSPGVANYSSMEKLFEGWVKRRKTKAELSANEVTNKWPKVWMTLKGHYLLLAASQYVKRPDIVINLVKATISDSTDLKTSKKNIFRITCQPMDYHFSCLTAMDWRNWIQKMKMAKEIYANVNQAPRIMTQSVSSYNNEPAVVNGEQQGGGIGQPEVENHRQTATLPRMLVTNGTSPKTSLSFFKKSGTIGGHSRNHHHK